MYQAAIEQQSMISTTDITEITRLYQKDLRKSISVTLATKLASPFHVSELGKLNTPEVVIADSLHPENADNGKYDRCNRVLFLILHYCCTSLDDVALSCINAITITSRKNTTAFACPIPFHCGPLLA